MPSLTRRDSIARRRRSALEALERRALLAAPTLAAIPDVTLLSGAPLHIPLDGFDADGDTLTYTVTSTNPAVARLLPTTNRSLRIAVSHTSSGANDPAFTGEMVFQLFEDRAPRTTARIIQLAQSGFYNGVIFHRVIPNFVIQGGDPTGTGTGGSGVDFDDEFHPDLQHTSSGLLSMAKSLDDTNDSQFFVTEGATRHLDFNHSIFGRLVEGESIRERISNVPRNAQDKPLGAVTITSATVITDPQNRVLTLSAPPGYTGASDITVTVSDGKGGMAQDTFRVQVVADTNNNLPFLGPVADIHTRANTPVNFQLAATDVEGDPHVFLNWVGIYDNFVRPFVDPEPGEIPPGERGQLISPDGNRFGQDIEVLVNGQTGAGQITPRNNVAGVFPIHVGVAQTLQGFDSQVAPLFVSPAAPSSVDLLAVSDTGADSGDDLTRLNNANSAGRLQFLVSGVLAGTEVSLFAGNTLIGTAVVPAGQTSVTVTTNGSAALSNGAHSITAVQTLKNQAWEVGNRSGTTNLASVASPALRVTIDAVAPTLAGQPAFAHGAAPHKITYRFSENVGASLGPTDVSVERPGFDQPPFFPELVSYDGTTNTATFVFSGVLGDGDYRATLEGSAVTDAAGNPLANNSVFDFWVLAADANRDRSVNFSDLVIVAQNYGGTGKDWGSGDFNADGMVNFNDLVQLAQNYGVTLPAPPPPPAGGVEVVDAEASKPVGAFSAVRVSRASAPRPVKRAASRGR